jgi:hypothetical protein
MQHDSADQLNIEMNHVPNDLLIANEDGFAAEPARRVFHEGKGVRQDLKQTAVEFVGIVNIGQILFPLGRLLPELIFRERLKLLFQAIDLFREGSNSFDLPLVLRS